MRVNPLFGSGVAGKSYVVTRQRRLNVYYENRADGDKTKAAVYGTPGLLLVATIPTPSNAPMRGMLGSPLGFLTVASSQFAALNSSNSITYKTSILSNSGPVQFASSAVQALLVDGVSGYVYAGGGLTPISSSGFPFGALTCTYVSNYFVAEVPGTQQFQVSNSGDATTWQALAFGAASQGPDAILAVDSLTSNLICFSQQHIEFQQNVGATPNPFAVIQSATAEWGIAAIFSRAHVGNSICFLAQSPQGGVSICQVQGYQIKKISSPDVDFIINSFSVVSDAIGLSYRIDEHAMYQITFPTANRSFLYDTTTGVFSETQTGAITGNYARHKAQFSALQGSQILLSDSSNNNLYTPSQTTYTDNGTPILREICTRHHLKDFNQFSIDELYLDMETGVGLPSGQGSSPVIGIEYSKDNGRTYMAQRLATLGSLGQYTSRAILRRFGSARAFNFRIRMTDPVKFVLTAPAISERERPQ